MSDPGVPTTGSTAWRLYFRAQYRLIRMLDPLVRPFWRLTGLGDTVDLAVRGRRTGLRRSVLVGMVQVDGRWYVGHPNGPSQWTRNVAAVGGGEVATRNGAATTVRAVHLGPGPEREAAIRATFTQHPFPGNVVYRLARRHIVAVGEYFRLEPVAAGEWPGASEKESR